MAGRPSHSKTLDVWMNGELVGYWTISQTGHQFEYAKSWFKVEVCRPISLSMPLVEGTVYKGPIVEYFFENLLPDDIDIRKRVAAQYNADSTSAFDLIAKIGRDCVGAVMIQPEDAGIPDVSKILADPLTDDDIEKLIDATLHGKVMGIGDEAGPLRLSIAGAQEKTALLNLKGKWHMPRGATPTTHILKLPLGTIGAARVDFSTSVENEFICARIANAYGLDAAQGTIETFGKYKVLSVPRFDREYHPDGWIIRLPQEDFCQVFGLPSTQKYQENSGPSPEQILEKLRGSIHAEIDRRNFLATQLLFWLLAAPDGHAKNFSIFLQRDGAFTTTPLYDIISVWPAVGVGEKKMDYRKLTLAMGIKGKNRHYLMSEIQRRHWNEMARNNNLGHDFEEVIEFFIERTESAIQKVESELTSDFPKTVSEPIFAGIRRHIEYLKRSPSTLVSN